MSSKAIRHDSANLNRIVADNLGHVILALGRITRYDLSNRFSFIYIESLYAFQSTPYTFLKSTC